MPAKSVPQLRWGSLADAASLARCSVRTIHKKIAAGLIRAERDGLSGRTRVCLDDVEKLLRDASAA
jgi:hypothetical protein